MKVREDLHLVHGSVKGPVRDENEDDYLLFEPEDEEEFRRRGRLLAIADGMGGEAGGGEASRVALRAFLAAWIDAGRARGEGEEEFFPLKTAFRRACEAVREESTNRPELLRMGCTLTAVELREGRILGIHVGDTRCLLSGPRGGRWLTELHADPDSPHRLTRAVGGGGGGEEPQTFRAELPEGSALLLLSDGLWNLAPEEAWLGPFVPNDVEGRARSLLASVHRGKGTDNATLIVAYRRPGGRADRIGEDVRILDPSKPGLPGFREPGLFVKWWPWFAVFGGLVLGLLALLFGRDS